MNAEESLGRKLRRCRKQVDSTIADLAQALGVSYNTLGGYERDETLPDVGFLALFAQKTGSSFLELLVARLQALGGDAGRRALSELPAAGAAPPPGFSESWGTGIDRDLLEEILREIDSWLAGRNAALAPEKKAKAVSLFYEMFAPSGRIDRAQVEKVLELLD